MLLFIVEDLCFRGGQLGLFIGRGRPITYDVNWCEGCPHPCFNVILLFFAPVTNVGKTHSAVSRDLWGFC
jgi:hypothetical protein